MRVSLGLMVLAAVALSVGFPSLSVMAEVPENPTFSKDVAPILNDNCVSCHRPGQIGPMSLMSYQEVRPWAKSIAKYVGEKTMPPWHADDGFGPFMNDRSLTDDEVATIVNWVNQGARQGSKKDLPPMPDFPDGEWALGAPDYEFTFDTMDLPADGPDLFRNFLHKTEFGEDKWLTAVDILPGDKKAVHHVILWEEGDFPGSGESWVSAWAAGGLPDEFAKGTGRYLKEGTTLVGDMHYHPSGEVTTDATSVGLYFADAKDIEKQLINLWVMNAEFEIPAGDENYEVRSKHSFPEDSQILSLTPHLHYRGKDFSYSLVYPDGNVKELLKVSDYDFNWQTIYRFEEPISAPAGSRIECIAHFDNSTDNPFNPDPTVNVRFGPESFDEMMIGFVDYVVEDGIRPTVKVDVMAEKVKDLVAAHPNEVFTISLPGQGDTAVLLPREGEGGWYIVMNGMVVSARIHEIAWVGDAFTAKFTIPGQEVQDLEGSVDLTKGVLNVKMPVGNGATMPLKATLAQ